MMLCRKMDLYMKNQINHEWKEEGSVTSIWNSTTLVAGLGDIGSEYAKRMKALGSHVIGIRRNVAEKPDFIDELYTMDQLDEVLPKVDFAVFILPSTPATHHIMDERRLRLMKPGSYLINAGRGDAVDCDALNKVLREGGALAGCALDVTEPEPLPADHPLWDAPRTIITPHSAGKFHLRETFGAHCTDHRGKSGEISGRREGRDAQSGKCKDRKPEIEKIYRARHSCTGIRIGYYYQIFSGRLLWERKKAERCCWWRLFWPGSSWCGF